MILNRFYYCFALLATIFLLSSCLNSDDDNAEYEYSSDAQIISLKLSSSEDSLNILQSVVFSINQVASSPIIFNRDSLPYLFDVSTVKMDVATNGASGVKLHLVSSDGPDSTYIWNMTDSVMIKKLKHIQVYAQDGTTEKLYTLQLNTHQQDPDTIFWQNVKNNYIDTPIDQVTVSSANSFFTYYTTSTSVGLSTSAIADGESWFEQPLSGLPQNVVLSSIQNDVIDGTEKWYALNANNLVYLSDNGVNWERQLLDYSVKSVLGKMPSLSDEAGVKDSILVVLKDGEKYKFAKTIDFSSVHILNEIPSGFPVDGFTSTVVKDSLIYTAKYLVTTGGKDINGLVNRDVWLLQEKGNKITSLSKRLNFNVTGSSLFYYDNKVYLLTPNHRTSNFSENVFYTSINYGVFWEKANSKQSLPAEFLYRKNQSVSVDNKNNIWIFGGSLFNESQLVEVWKGRINKLFVK